MRFKAIYKALYHGIFPYWMYEKVRHYQCSYIYHLWINLCYAFRWLTFTEDESDIEFENQINKTTMLQKFATKQEVIEAEQYTQFGKLVKGMCNSQTCFVEVCDKPHVHGQHGDIFPLEVGDWVIPDINGEGYYPVKPELFEKSYEPITNK